MPIFSLLLCLVDRKAVARVPLVIEVLQQTYRARSINSHHPNTLLSSWIFISTVPGTKGSRLNLAKSTKITSVIGNKSFE